MQNHPPKHYSIKQLEITNNEFIWNKKKYKNFVFYVCENN